MSGGTLVWLKRDLRLQDHAPLHAAAQAPAALAIYVIEPAWVGSPEFHPRQLAWALAAVRELQDRLLRRGLPLLIHQGAMPEVLSDLRRTFAFDTLLSHEETGPRWTWDRDRAVARWCAASGVRWQEWPQHGVARPLRSRDGWAGRWQQQMDAPPLPVPPRWRGIAIPVSPPPTLPLLGLPGTEPGTPPGERAGLARLHDFLSARGRGYRTHLSSPLSAAEGCSRLSEHLAFGTLSMRQVHQATARRIAELRTQDGDARRFAHDLRGFAGRLRWHCHFIQKLEDEPDAELRNFARSYDGLRPGDGVDWGASSACRFQAWRAGQTGYPMVDACMRSLVATGWLNFRMRAMLVSFAAYHLWLHWREPGLHLARQFLDFEPGIHWSQMQMQSGTTGINTLRIYSPSKQALDHDPDGIFIRRWVPELEGVPKAYLAEPWRMPAGVQRVAGCSIGRDYPAPIVDHREAVNAAKTLLYPLRASVPARAEAKTLVKRHGSRKAGTPAPRRGRRAGPSADIPPQRSLFGEEPA